MENVAHRKLQNPPAVPSSQAIVVMAQLEQRLALLSRMLGLINLVAEANEARVHSRRFGGLVAVLIARVDGRLMGQIIVDFPVERTESDRLMIMHDLPLEEGDTCLLAIKEKKNEN